MAKDHRWNVGIRTGLWYRGRWLLECIRFRDFACIQFNEYQLQSRNAVFSKEREVNYTYTGCKLSGGSVLSAGSEQGRCKTGTDTDQTVGEKQCPAFGIFWQTRRPGFRLTFVQSAGQMP